jgi:hypothetical protein
MRVAAGPPPLLVVRGADMSPHGFSRQGDTWVRDMLRFESSDLKRWFPGFLPGDIKETPREQVVLTAPVPAAVEAAPETTETAPAPSPDASSAAEEAVPPVDTSVVEAEAPAPSGAEVAIHPTEMVAEPAKPKPVRKNRKADQEAEAAAKAAEQEEWAERFRREQDALRAEYLQDIEARRAELIHAPASVQPYYAMALQSFQQELTEGKEFIRDDRAHRLEYTADPASLYQAIIALDGLPGVKAPRDLGNEYQIAAIWTDAGELSVTHYPGRVSADIPEYSVSYSLQKNATLETYHDRLKQVIPCASEAEFDKRKTAGWGLGSDPADAPIPVKAIDLDGQLITFMGAAYGGRRDDGSRHNSAYGWTLVPAADFEGATFTRAKAQALWESGEVDRGDMKGMLVRVRGKDYVCVDPIAMVYRQPGEAQSWDFIESFPMPREIDGVPYLLSETPAGKEQSALRAVHAERASTLIASLVGIDEAKAGLESGKNPQTGRAPTTPRTKEELEGKLTADLVNLPVKFEADLDGYEQHFGRQARDQFEAYVRATYARLRSNLTTETDQPDTPVPATVDPVPSEGSEGGALPNNDPDPADAPAVVAIATRQPTRIGQRVLKILVAAEIRDRVMDEDGFEHAIQNHPFPELCVERVWLPEGWGIALTRYGESDAGRHISAEVVFLVDPDGLLVIHETCKFSEEQGSEVRSRDPKFADALVKEWVEQGFATSAPERKKKITDAGEKIGGARKDMYATVTIESLLEMNDREKVTYVTKDAIWPSIDIAQAKENGVPLDLLVMGRELRALIPPAIKIPSLVEPYLRVVSALRKAYEGATSSNDLIDAIGRAALDAGVIEDRQESRFGRTEKVPVRGTTSLYTDFQGGGWDYRKIHKIFWNPHVLARKGRLFAEAWGRDGADGYAALSARYSRTGPRGESDDGKLPARPHLVSIQRTGLPDEREGRDISAEELMSRFGFRAVEFGNWLPQDERQDVLNRAYDSLCTLTRVTGFPDRMMSLDGTLAAAFGSRGKSKAAAHYEPCRVVFNLTRMNGAGSMAHEYFHALDDWMATVIRKHYDGKSSSLPAAAMFATEFALEQTKSRRRRPSTIRPVTRDLSWHRDLFADVAPWFNMAASFVQRHQSLEEYRERLVASEASHLDALHKWIRFGVRANGVSEEDATRHATEAMKSIDIDELRRLFNRLFSQDERSNLSALSVNNALGGILESKKQLERFPEDVNLPVLKTDYFANAKFLDAKKSKPYYALPTELGARAFECYVFDQIAALGGRDDYLVHGVEEARFSEAEGYRGNPYPTGEDRKEINRRMAAALKNIAEVFVPSYTYKTTGDLFAPVPRMAACR